MVRVNRQGGGVVKRIYVAGKLNGLAVDYVKNCHRMIKKAVELQRAGNQVFVPCLDILMGLFDGADYEHYAGNNMGWLEVADQVYVLAGYETSKGTLAEIARAKELGIEIVYETH